ncbi:MAG: class I SAM-dependent methyltransferase [Alphaproteobacteria bacterium]
MSKIETAVARHYGASDLLARILAGLEAGGADLGNMRPGDLAPVDEFHIGGRKASERAVEKLGPRPDQHVLDIGCGIGGTARYIAERYGCRVTGIDLTPDYIEVARALTIRTGLAGKVEYHLASALDMPFGEASFDAAISIHVAMNIHDRAGLYGEIARVLKPGARLCVYDVMSRSGEEIVFPVPWAEGAETSYLTTPDEMRILLGEAGFEIVEVEDRTDFAIEFFKQSRAGSASGPPPLGLHLLMGASAPEKFRNMLANIESGRIAPVQIIARR